MSVIPGNHGRICNDFLYAVEFANGRVKIGHSKKPRARMRQLLRQYGLAIVRVRLAPFGGPRCYLAERDALERARRIANSTSQSTEIFDGLSFGAAANLVAQMARREYAFQPAPSTLPVANKRYREKASAVANKG